MPSRPFPRRPAPSASTFAAALAALAALAVAAGCGGGAGGAGTKGPGGSPPAISTAPAPVLELTGTPLSWGIWKAVVPAGLTVTSAADHVTLSKDSDRCHLTLWQPVAAQADLDAQANAIFQAAFTFTGYGGVRGLIAASPLLESNHRRTVTGDGFFAVELRGEAKTATGGNTGEHVNILAFQVGGQVATLLGWQASGEQGCLDEVLDPQAWSMLAYSIAFPSVQAPDPAALKKALVGGWFGADTVSSIAWSDVFYANGRHSDLIGIETWRTVSPTEVLDTFSAWQGTSWWDVSGNKLTTWPLDTSKPAITRHVRIFDEYNTVEASGWRTYWYKLDLCGSAPCEGWSVLEPN